MRALLKDFLDPRRAPWLYLALTLAALIPTAFPALRAPLIYDRAALAHGEAWRLWTGHLVHFGWVHYLADGALFVLIGWFLKRDHPAFAKLSLLLLPPAVSAAVYCFDPLMAFYGGLSGVNVGLLVFLACCGWQKDWRDWFWPAILGIHVVEVVIEAKTHGTGGGAIKFDTPAVRVATVAHLGGVAYGLAAWALVAVRAKKSAPPK